MLSVKPLDSCGTTESITDIRPDGHASEDAALDPTDPQAPMDLAEIDPDDEPSTSTRDPAAGR